MICVVFIVSITLDYVRVFPVMLAHHSEILDLVVDYYLRTLFFNILFVHLLDCYFSL